MNRNNPSFEPHTHVKIYFYREKYFAYLEYSRCPTIKISNDAFDFFEITT